MSDIEKDLRDELAREAGGVQGLPRDLWLRIVEGPGTGVPIWLKLAPIAVAVLFLGTTGLLLVRSQHPVPPGAAPLAAASATPGRTAAPRATARPTSPSPTANSDTFACGAAPSGGAGTAGGNLTAVRVAHQEGFDRVTFEFAGSGIPAYTISPQPGTRFTQDASGKPIDVQGIAGLRIVFRNASGVGTYTGSADIKLAPGVAPDKSSIVEVRALGDFERVLSWGAGLNTKPACLRILQLGSPARLVIDVQDNR